MRGIYQRHPGSGVWFIRWAAADGRIRKERVGYSKRLALDLYRKRKTEAKAGKEFPQRRMCRFKELAADMLEYASAHLSPDTNRAGRIRTLVHWWGERPAAQVTAQDIERRLTELAQSRAPATVNRYHALVRRVYSLGIRNGKVEVNPARQIRQRREDNARVRFLSAEEETALRGKIRKLYPEREPEFDLALHTGMRWGEQYRLRWPEADMERDILTIRRSKPGERRYVPMNSVARIAVEALRRDATETVCAPGQQGWFERVVKEARVGNFLWHDLRHTFASRLAMNGESILTIKELLGHKTLAMTLRYAHLAPDFKRAAVERLVKRTGPASAPR